MMSEWDSTEIAKSGHATRPDHGLHLPSLGIIGFRGIKKLSIPRLGRVTLLAGKNGVGKTTVLEAVRIYASRARQTALSELLMNREEITVRTDEVGEWLPMSDGRALFHGRDTSADACLSIGPLAGADRLRIEVASLSGEPDSMLEELLVKSRGHGTRVMKVTLRDAEELIPPGPALLPHDLKLLLAAEGSAMPPEIPCESLGPSLPDSNDIARLWDRVTLTDDEDRVLRAVNLASGEEVVRIAVIGDGIGQSEQSPHGRRVVVRLRDHKHPLPIKGLGDGAVRLLGIAVALANSQDGFLLIDEAENGIHHALQRDFWRMVLQTAQDNNVQVFATTHGWDCVRGFAQAAIELDAVEGVLVRLERKGDRIQAVEYPEEELIIAAQSGIEVR